MTHNGRVGRSAFISTEWLSDSSIRCVIAPGIGTEALVSLTVLNLPSGFLLSYLLEFQGRELQSSLPGKLDYQIPKVLTLSPENCPGVRSGHNITINWQFFGYRDSTPRAAVVGTACETVSWTSDTTISCIISHRLVSPPCAISGYEQESLCYALRCNSEAAFTDPACRAVKVEIGQQRGSTAGFFSFDRPQLDFLYPSNSLASGGTNVTVIGLRGLS